MHRTNTTGDTGNRTPESPGESTTQATTQRDNTQGQPSLAGELETPLSSSAAAAVSSAYTSANTTNSDIHEAPARLLDLRQIQRWNEQQSTNEAEALPRATSTKRPASTSPQPAQIAKVARAPQHEIVSPRDDRSQAAYPPPPGHPAFGRGVVIPMFQGLQEDFTVSRPDYLHYGYGVMPPGIFNLTDASPVPFPLIPMNSIYHKPGQMPQSAPPSPGSDRYDAGKSPSMYSYLHQQGAPGYEDPISPQSQRDRVSILQAGNSYYPPHPSVQTPTEGNSTTVNPNPAQGTSSKKPRSRQSNSKVASDTRAQRRQRGLKERAESLRQQRTLMVASIRNPHTPTNTQPVHDGIAPPSRNEHPAYPSELGFQPDMELGDGQSMLYHPSLNQFGQPAQPMYAPPTGSYDHQSASADSNPLSSLRYRTPESDVKPPEASSAVMAQRVTDYHEEYHLDVKLYQIDTKKTTCQDAQSWLDGLFIPFVASQVKTRSVLHATEGFIHQGDGTHFIVMHNAASPIDDESPAKHTTTIGVYGYYWYEPSKIFWTTYVPGLELPLLHATAAGDIKEVFKWSPGMGPREKRFHKAYWLCAKRFPLGGLLNYAKHPNEGRRPELVEEDIEVLDVTEDDITDEWDLSAEESKDVWEEMWSKVVEELEWPSPPTDHSVLQWAM